MSSGGVDPLFQLPSDRMRTQVKPLFLRWVMISYEELSLVFDMENPLTLEYFELCNKDTHEQIYCESHHKLPKAIWKEHKDAEWNFVRLSYPRHFRSHEILPQICLQKRHRLQMLKAWSMMSGREGAEIDVDTYNKLKIEYRDFLSEANSGSGNPMFGRKCTQEHKDKISVANTGRRRISDEEIVRRRKAHLERLQDKSDKYTAEKRQEFIDFLELDTNLTMVGEYIGSSKPILFKCDRGHRPFLRRPVDVRREQGCTLCYKEDTDYYASRRISQEEFEQHLKDNTNLTLIRGFVDMSTKCWFKCDCGHAEFEQKPIEIKRGRVCRVCKKKTRKKNKPVTDEHRANLSKVGRRPPEVFLSYLSEHTNLHMISDYVKMQERVWFQCDREHEPFFKTPSQVKAGEVCKHCNREDRLKVQNDKT